jgi:hypothetical protein
MSDTQSLARRFRRYNETLFMLAAADELGWSYLTRIQIQKIVYLCEMLAPFRDILVAFLEYRYHHKGPYARDLQNGVDHLVACGLVDLVYYAVAPNSRDVPTHDGNVEVSQYRISKDGLSMVDALCCWSSNRELRDLVTAVSQLVDTYELKNVVRLVYQEPTFLRLKTNGLRGNAIYAEGTGNLSTDLLGFLDELGRNKMKYQHWNWKALLLAYFEVLWCNHKLEVQEGI